MKIKSANSSNNMYIVLCCIYLRTKILQQKIKNKTKLTLFSIKFKLVFDEQREWKWKEKQQQNMMYLEITCKIFR